MNSYLVYRASFYLMLFVATMALSGDSPEGQFAKLLSLIVAVAAVVAFLTVDRPGKWALSRRMANVLAVGTLGLLYFEYRLDDTQRIPALAHWLVYLQLIKFFLPKTAEDDWFLFLLGLMQVLIGSVINQSDEVGAWLFLWAMLAVWVLGQFFLQREARPILAVRAGPGGLGSPMRPPVDPYRRPVRPSVRRGDGPRHGDDAALSAGSSSSSCPARRVRPGTNPVPRWPNI